jgi:hypothetical protein
MMRPGFRPRSLALDHLAQQVEEVFYMHQQKAAAEYLRQKPRKCSGRIPRMRIAAVVTVAHRISRPSLWMVVCGLHGGQVDSHSIATVAVIKAVLFEAILEVARALSVLGTGSAVAAESVGFLHTFRRIKTG